MEVKLKMDIDQHVSELLKAMAEGVYEKEHILAMSLLSAVAGESIFLLGPPGTAKSLVARRLKMIFSLDSVHLMRSLDQFPSLC